MRRPITNLSDYDEDSRLCWCCISDKYLKMKIRVEGEKKDCAFCEELGPAFSLAEIADLVERAFSEHFERTSTDPSGWNYFRIKELDYDWEREGEPVHHVIAEIVGIHEDIAEVIARILEERHSNGDMALVGEETEFDRDSHYTPKLVSDSNSLHQEWSCFEHQLQIESRFLNRSFFKTLDKVFSGLEKFKTFNGGSVIKTIGPETDLKILFRARVFQESEALFHALKRPEIEIGTPPRGRARAGRMNAAGISVFYGALAAETAIAEVRPPVGSDVAVASFEIVRSLRVLDLPALWQIIVNKSYFDPESFQLQERAAFLQMLSDKMTRPVMPEKEHTDYLITQAIADYLASEHGLDGMLYLSVQTATELPSIKRTNIVLFHLASSVEPDSLPDGTKITVERFRDHEDPNDSEFVVFEEVPKQKRQNDRKKSDLTHDPLNLNHEIEVPGIDGWFPDRREASLRLIPDTVTVHQIVAVNFTTETIPVTRVKKETETE